MAEFQWRAGTPLVGTINAVVGNTLLLKLIPGKNEKVPIQLTVTPPNIAEVVQIDNRPKPNFATFALNIKSKGRARLTAGPDANKPIGGPIIINIEEALAYPDAGTNIGLLVRLFLGETTTPDDTKKYDATAAEQSMILMRVVVENRLKKPSGVWGSAGAKALSDVVRAKGQFDGFDKYPKLLDRIQGNIDDLLRIANDGGDLRRERTKAHIQLALKIANATDIKDPSPNGLYWWRTKDSGSPTPESVIYKSIMSNTFFQLKK
jgi:hypothetical protein